MHYNGSEWWQIFAVIHMKTTVTMIYISAKMVLQQWTTRVVVNNSANKVQHGNFNEEYASCLWLARRLKVKYYFMSAWWYLNTSREIPSD